MGHWLARASCFLTLNVCFVGFIRDTGSFSLPGAFTPIARQKSRGSVVSSRLIASFEIAQHFYLMITFVQ